MVHHSVKQEVEKIRQRMGRFDMQLFTATFEDWAARLQEQRHLADGGLLDAFQAALKVGNLLIIYFTVISSIHSFIHSFRGSDFCRSVGRLVGKYNVFCAALLCTLTH